MEHNISYCLDLYYDFDFYDANLESVSDLIKKLFVTKKKKIDYSVIASILKIPTKNIVDLIYYICYTYIKKYNISIRELCTLYNIDETIFGDILSIDYKIVNLDTNKTIQTTNKKQLKKYIKPQHYIVYIYDDIITIHKRCIFSYDKKEFCYCNNYHCKSYQVSYKCGNCKCVSYCSKECQKTNWKYHKLVCNQLSNKLTTKRDRKKQTYHNILMKNFTTYLNSYQTVKYKHWTFNLDNDNNYVFSVITHLDCLNLEKYNSNIVLFNELIDILFVIL